MVRRGYSSFSRRNIYVSVGSATYAVEINAGGIITKAPPIVKWAIGMDIDDFRMELLTRFGSIDKWISLTDFTPERTGPSWVQPYYQELAKKFENLMMSTTEDWAQMTRQRSIDSGSFGRPWHEIAMYWVGSPENRRVAMLENLSQLFIHYGSDQMLINVNVEMFFKELAQGRILKKGVPIPYEELFESMYDDSIMSDEMVAGTIGRAEQRFGELLNRSTIIGEDTESEILWENLAEEIVIPRAQALLKEARRIDDTRTENRMHKLFDEMDSIKGKSRLNVEAMISSYPELGDAVRSQARKLTHTPYRRSDLVETTRHTARSKEERHVAMMAYIHKAEAKGIDPALPFDANLLAEQAGVTHGTSAMEVQDIWRDAMYGITGQRPISTEPGTTPEDMMTVYPWQEKDEPGKKRKPAKWPATSVKLDKSFSYKFYKGVMTAKVAIKGTKPGDFLPIGLVQKMFEKYGGDKDGLKRVKRAYAVGMRNVITFTVKEMMPIWEQMMHEEMLEWREKHPGVFFEFVPDATTVDFKTTRWGNVKTDITFKWARIVTSRSLLYGDPKKGKIGERGARVKFMGNIINRARRQDAIRIARGYIRELQGQSFIIQKSLKREQRSGLEQMGKSQFSRSAVGEVSSLWGEEAGRVAQDAVAKGYSVHQSLANHLRAQPGDTLNLFQSDTGEIGVTVMRRTRRTTPGKKPSVPTMDMVMSGTTYRPVSSVTVGGFVEIEPQEPVSDSFRTALRAIKAGGWSGNIFQKLANILWCVDVPMPDLRMEQSTIDLQLPQQQMVVARQMKKEIDTKSDREIAEKRTARQDDKKIPERVTGEVINSTSRVIMNMINQAYPHAVTEAWVKGLT